jgi:hypothetical protein
LGSDRGQANWKLSLLGRALARYPERTTSWGTAAAKPQGSYDGERRRSNIALATIASAVGLCIVPANPLVLAPQSQIECTGPIGTSSELCP